MNRCYKCSLESVRENEMHEVLSNFEIQKDHLISARRPELVRVNKKKKKRESAEWRAFTVPADNRMKIKESEKRGEYIDLAWELKKKLWNMKVTVIPLVVSAFRTIPKGLVKRR